MFKTVLKNIAKFLPIIGLLLFSYILYDIGFEKTIEVFLLIPWYYYVLSLLIFLPNLFLAGIQWQYLNKKQEIHISYSNVLKLYLLGLFYGSVTPSSIGMHIRVYYLKKKSQESFEKCTANSLIESTIATLAGLFLAVIGSGIFAQLYPGIFPVVLGFFIIHIVGFTFFLKKKSGYGFFSFILRPFLPGARKDNLDIIISRLYENIPRLRDLIIPFIIDSVMWIITAIQVYVLALFFSINISLVDFVLLSILSVIIAYIIPLTIGGLGLREGAFVVFLSAYNVPTEVAFVLSLSGFFVKNLIPGLIGFCISVFEKESPFEAIQSSSK